MKYYGLDIIIEHCTTGQIDMHEPIEVSNQYQTMKTQMTILKHFVILSKSEKIPLIYILSRLRCSIKLKLQQLISNNAFVRHYIENLIDEWRLDISVSELLKDGLGNCDYIEGDTIFNYQDFVDELKISQSGGAQLDEIEQILKERQETYKPMTPEYSKQMKSKLSDLHNDSISCVDRVKQHSITISSKYKAMEPHHLQLLIDLSYKPKSAYLEFCNQFKDSNQTFALFLSDSNNIEIPDNIHTIFLNYLITVNMIKKELNYINYSLKEIIIFMDPKLDILQKLVNSFTYIDDSDDDEEQLDGDGLQKDLVIVGDQSMLDKIKDFSFF